MVLEVHMRTSLGRSSGTISENRYLDSNAGSIELSETETLTLGSN